MTPREWLGEEDYKKYKTHYDELMHFRKTIKGKPTIDQRIELLCNNEMIDWYKTILFHNSLNANCDCRACTLQKQGIDIYDYAPYQTDLFFPIPTHKFNIIDKLENMFRLPEVQEEIRKRADKILEDALNAIREGK